MIRTDLFLDFDEGGNDTVHVEVACDLCRVASPASRQYAEGRDAAARAGSEKDGFSWWLTGSLLIAVCATCKPPTGAHPYAG